MGKQKHDILSALLELIFWSINAFRIKFPNRSRSRDMKRNHGMLIRQQRWKQTFSPSFQLVLLHWTKNLKIMS